MKLRFSGLLGKYRDLVLAIALFLVIDMGVLAFNYQSSRLLEADTSRINLAGDMRVFSQQLAKAVLSLKQESQDGMPTQTSIAQISEAYTAHNHALVTLQEDVNQPKREIFDDLARIEQARALLVELSHNWKPLSDTIEPLLSQGVEPMPMDIDIAANKVVARNIKLMQQADDLTKHLESMAVNRAEQMRRVQLIAMLLALANFVFIVFKFLRSLSRSDRAAMEAQEETKRILGTVREGLFLLERDGDVRTQQSRSTAALLGCKLSAGDNFFGYLNLRMPDERAKMAVDFITVLFNERVKPALLKQLNPLREVELEMANGKLSYLDFEFQQVLLEGRVEYLLVSVSDITEKIVLARELDGAKAKAKSDVDSLLGLLDNDPVTVSTFLNETNERLLGINQALQEVSPSNVAYQQLVNQIARVVHGIKGESGTLELISIETAAHAFEDVLSPLRGKKEISGDELIPVAVAMNDLLEDVEKVRRVVSRLLNFTRQGQPVEETPLNDVIRQIEQLTLRVANDLNKKVRFEALLPEADLPRSLIRVLREALPQLIRNAVAHGIESAEERLLSGKPEEGVIRCTLDVGKQGHLVIAVEDDGRGIEAHVLRQQVIVKGLKTAEEVALMSDEDVVTLIFTPGFSSLNEANTHAGRGEGLSVVKDIAERWGARLQISSRSNSYTRFAFLFKDNRWLLA
ncbi:ATP-binding protein [Propionivibrio sp.]|uniref:ATP-binding protein n=1 Tax=Propionivibrio sp. TaxID=2212460 RepID=UPI003BEFF0D0